jgi:ribosomal protein L37AE/L43A
VQTIKICENCKRNFYGWISSSRHHCCRCESQLETRGNQIWRCYECGCERSSGTESPPRAFPTFPNQHSETTREL